MNLNNYIIKDFNREEYKVIEIEEEEGIIDTDRRRSEHLINVLNKYFNIEPLSYAKLLRLYQNIKNHDKIIVDIQIQIMPEELKEIYIMHTIMHGIINDDNEFNKIISGILRWDSLKEQKPNTLEEDYDGDTIKLIGVDYSEEENNLMFWHIIISDNDIKDMLSNPQCKKIILHSKTIEQIPLFNNVLKSSLEVFGLKKYLKNKGIDSCSLMILGIYTLDNSVIYHINIKEDLDSYNESLYVKIPDSDFASQLILTCNKCYELKYRVIFDQDKNFLGIMD